VSRTLKTRKTTTVKVRVCASRKGQKTGPHKPIEIGQEIGWLKVTGRAANDAKHRCVNVDCLLCGGKGSCRFDEFLNRTAKSCRCLRDAAFWNNQTGFAAAVSEEKASNIFTDIHLGLDKFEIAEKRNIQSYTVDFVKRIVYARLEAIPAATRTEIYSLAQVNVDAAMWRFKMSKAEVMAVCTIQKQQAAAQTATVAAVEVNPADPAKPELQSAWDAFSPAQKDEAKELRMDLYHSVLRMCQGKASKVVEFSDLLGPSAFKEVVWLADLLKVLPDPLHTSFEGFTRKAHEIMSTSRAVNKRNMMNAMKARTAGKQLRRRRRAKIVSINKFEETYVPYNPNMSTPEIVKVLTIIDGAKIAA
jgi:pyruvate/2-oxoglutarate dehydrogenase complex dihydrolipoamide acyltransferase (E2) component